MAWVFSRAGGTRWYGGWKDPTTLDRHGVPIRRTERLLGVTTREEAEAAVAGWKWGRERRGEKVEVDDALKAFLEERASHGTKDTSDYYREKLSAFFARMAGTPIARWTRADVRLHIEDQRREPKKGEARRAWSAASVKKFLAALAAFVRWAREDRDPGIAVADLTAGVRAPEGEAHESEAWTEEEASAILREARTPTRGAFAALDLPLHLNLHAALPLGDIRTLTWAEIDRSAEPWTIRGVRHKRKAIKRDIPVNEALRAALMRYPAITPDAKVCQRLPASDGSLAQAHRRLLARAGIAKDRRSGGWHRGRHTCLSILGAHGADLATLRRYACHGAGSSVTARYLHTDKARMKAASEVLAKRLA